MVGYGNSLRSDDGVGLRVAELLTDDPRTSGSVVLTRHQLTPELALDFSRASHVVLIDASVSLPAGEVAVTAVGPPACGAEPTEQSGSHHVTPAHLLGLSEELYGHAPRAHLVSVGGHCFDLGAGLTQVVEAALPRVVAVVADLLAC